MNYFWPSIRKHVLSTIAFSRGFEVALTPYGNPLETLWNPLENLWKPCGNPFETLWNPFETLWNPLETLLKCFETLWNVETLNPLEMFRILFENTIWKCQGKKGILVCVRWRMRDSAACYNFFFADMLFCRMIQYWFILVERSKDITHVKLLPSLMAKILDVCKCKCE